MRALAYVREKQYFCSQNFKNFKNFKSMTDSILIILVAIIALLVVMVGVLLWHNLRSQHELRRKNEVIVRDIHEIANLHGRVENLLQRINRAAVL